MAEIIKEIAALSKKLRDRMLDGMAFSLAVKNGYIVVREDGHLQWMLGSKTLLAYFCGRLWCGDMPIYSNCSQKYIWLSGGKRFPKKDLTDLFGVRNLRTLREQRYMGFLPTGWEKIEKIFEK